MNEHRTAFVNEDRKGQREGWEREGLEEGHEKHGRQEKRSAASER